MTKSLFLSVALAFSVTAPPTPIHAQDGYELSAQGDAKKGKREFNKCKMCHNLTKAAKHRLGPNLNDLFGSAAGKKEGFKYSKALGNADFVWTEEKLNQWLERPRSFLPGNRMAFAGIRKEQSRYNLIAYLREATQTK